MAFSHNLFVFYSKLIIPSGILLDREKNDLIFDIIITKNGQVDMRIS